MNEEAEDLIAEARDQAAYLRGVSRDGSMPYSGELLKSLADALESVRAERDAALARIAELEMTVTSASFEFHEQFERAEQAESRIAEAAKLHRKYTYYELEDYCLDTTDEHREEHHHESSDDIGEFYCDQMPTGDVCCANCRDVNGDRMEWPCPTAVSLGLNEGEGDDY